MVLDPFSSLAGLATLCQLAIKAGMEVKSHKENCANLVNRIKVLVPLIEEVRCSDAPLSQAQSGAFYQLEAAVEKAKLLLEECKGRSKIYMVYKGITMIQKFKDVCLELDRTLNTLPLVQLRVSDQIQAQVKQASEELRRTKFAVDAVDQKISEEIAQVLRAQREGQVASQELLKKLAAHLDMTSKEAVKTEAQALVRDKAELSAQKEHLEEQYVNQIIGLLLELESTAVIDSKEIGGSSSSSSSNRAPLKLPPVPPDELRCPISLEVMYDPVIAASGQTFERALIQKWLDEGHTTCPITRQPLLTQHLIPNIAVKKMIATWCEDHGVPPPTPPVLPPPTSPSGRVLPTNGGGAKGEGGGG